MNDELKQNILKDLNEEQTEAVKNIDGPVLILAGAGTGKTKTLVHRTAYMLASGISAKNILLLTFTNKAAIRDVVHQGKECITRSIHYTENLDWLKEKGFKYTKHPQYEDLYIISWKDC